MDGIFVGHHGRTGALALLRGMQRKTADLQWDNEFIRKCRGVPWMLIGEEPEVRPPPVLAVVMPSPEAIVRTPQQRRRYILKTDVARYGPTPGCEACVALAGGAQRVTKPQADECRARMDELMQPDEDALVQQRLHADRLKRGSMTARASGDERRDPNVEMVGSGLLPGSSGDALRVGGAEEPMGTAVEDADTRRGLNISAELPLDDGARDLVRGLGEHLDRDVPLVTPIVQQAEQGADAADAHMSVGKMEMISRAAAKMTNSAVAGELTSDEIWTLAKTAIDQFGASVSKFANKFTSYSIGSSLFIDMTAKGDDGQFWDPGTRVDQENWNTCSKNIKQNS